MDPLVSIVPPAPTVPAGMAGVDLDTLLEDLACAARIHQGNALLCNAAAKAVVQGSDAATVRPGRRS